MSRLSIEVTPEQHKRLKAIAALQGKSIKDYILERTLPPPHDINSLSEEEALQRLEDFLEPRIESAKKRNFSARSIDKIFEDVKKTLK